jgi:Domain of unknown function (DUF4160)
VWVLWHVDESPPAVEGRGLIVGRVYDDETGGHSVAGGDGEAKFWVEPEIELARNYELSDQDLKRALELIVDREEEIRDAWTRHFGS